VGLKIELSQIKASAIMYNITSNMLVSFNKHFRPELRWPTDRSKNITASRSMEAFHYVSYIPYNGHLFELDGLKPHPIDHGKTKI